MDPSNLQKHIHADHQGKTWDCDVPGCGQQFTHPANLRTHKQAVHEGKRWECDVEGCDASYGNPSPLRKHFKKKHTVQYNQSKVREESIVKDLLKDALKDKPFGTWLSDMTPQLPVDYACAIESNMDYGRESAKIDFVLPAEKTQPKNNTIIALEVDEFYHRREAQSCETARMYNCTTSWLMQNINAPPRVVWIRYNPHGFQVDGVTKRTGKEERQQKLLQVLERIASEPIDADVPRVRIIYMFYPTENGVPCVLEEEGYSDMVSEWFDEAIV